MTIIITDAWHAVLLTGAISLRNINISMHTRLQCYCVIRFAKPAKILRIWH